jgi:hypothetical protein
VPSFDTGIVPFGTCFAQGIAEDMGELGLRVHWRTEICHHFSPATLADALERAVGLVAHDQSDLITTPSGMISPYGYKFGHEYGQGSGARDRVIARLAEIGAELTEALRDARLIMLTLGTARVVRLKLNRRAAVQIKMLPRDWWYTEMMDVDETIHCLNRIHGALAHYYGGPAAVPPMVVTVSPQRYLFTSDDISTDPFVDNSLNKSILRLAVDRFIAGNPDRDLVYFPSYEIVLDELRLFEPMQSLGDHAHIGNHTRPYVLRKFFRNFAAPAVVEQLNLIADIEKFADEMSATMPLGLPPTEPRIIARLVDLLDRAEALGAERGAKLSGMIARLTGLIAGTLDSDKRLDLMPTDDLSYLISLLQHAKSLLEEDQDAGRVDLS